MKSYEIDLAKLKEGDYIRSTATFQIFQVMAIGPVFHLRGEKGDTKTLAENTVVRWYRYVEFYPGEVTPVLETSKDLLTEVVATKKELSKAYVEKELPLVKQSIRRQQGREEAAKRAAERKPPIQGNDSERTAPTKFGKPFAEDDPVVQQLRERLITAGLKGCPSSTRKTTKFYDALKINNKNFAEIYIGKTRFHIRIIADALTPTQIPLCTIAPEYFNWSLDATFSVLSEQDFETALNMILISYAYRVKHINKRNPFIKKDSKQGGKLF